MSSNQCTKFSARNKNPDNEIGESQTLLLELLKEFDAICKKNNIQYSLHGGTLLGAVREHGFIPWDDDVDVAMTRSEFERFTEVFQNEKKGCYMIAQLARSFRIFSNDKQQKVTTWLDIFIYDSITENRFFQKIKLYLLVLLDAMGRKNETIQLMSQDTHNKFEILIFKAAYYFGKLFTNATKTKLLDKISKNYFIGKKQYIHRSNDQLCGRRMVIPKEWMMSYILLPFEDTNFMVTSNYHDVLVSSYGSDYMTPRKDAITCSGHKKLHEFYSKSMH